jgi:hypothetical protein
MDYMELLIKLYHLQYVSWSELSESDSLWLTHV